MLNVELSNNIYQDPKNYENSNEYYDELDMIEKRYERQGDNNIMMIQNVKINALMKIHISK